MHGRGRVEISALPGTMVDLAISLVLRILLAVTVAVGIARAQTPTNPGEEGKKDDHDKLT